MKVDVAYLHTKRSTTNQTNADFGIPVLKGITNETALHQKHLLVVDDMLDKGITMRFVLEELKKYNPKSIHVAVLYNFTKLETEENYIIGLSMEEKKWIVYPWETELLSKEEEL